MLDKNLLRGDILEALSRKPFAEADLRALLDASYPADLAEIIEELSLPRQLAVLRSIDPEMAGDVLSEVDEHLVKRLLGNLLNHVDITPILNEMAPDDGADLVALLPAEAKEAALFHVEPEHAEAIRTLAEHDPETAGGVMTTEFVTVRPEITVGDALETLRSSLDVEDISNVYVADRRNKLVGVLSVRDILDADPEAPVGEVMTKDVVAARLDEDQEDASRILDRYEFTSLPVVDDGGRIAGVITIDDAMDVLEEEAEEDIAFIAGSGMVGVRDGIGRHLRMRLPWLLITMGGGLAAAAVSRSFEKTIVDVPALMFFIPVILGMAGNVGIQSSAVMVRGFATGEMEMSIAGQTILKQVAIGLSVGLICGILTGLAAALMIGPLRLGIAVAASMVAGIGAAAASGTTLPIICQKLNVDPAVASGPFITTMNDLLGLLIYFAVATTLFLHIQ